jgi:hypothetical protein
MLRRPPGPINSHRKKEEAMTTGSVLYLLLCIVAFGVLSGVLAYQSWKQSRLGPEVVTIPSPTSHVDPRRTITA